MCIKVEWFRSAAIVAKYTQYITTAVYRTPHLRSARPPLHGPVPAGPTTARPALAHLPTRAPAAAAHDDATLAGTVKPSFIDRRLSLFDMDTVIVPL